MKLNPPANMPPERIIVFGNPGCGKSTAALSLARVAGGNVFVIDTDYSASYHRLLATEFTDIADNVSVEVVSSDDWVGIISAVRNAVEVAGPGDWIVLDSISPTWQALQTHYINIRHGEDFLDVFALAGKDATRQTTDADMNWQAINAEYNKLYRLLLGSQANVLITAEQDSIGDRDDKKLQQLYGAYGVKPKGQKALGHTTHSVLWLKKARTGEYAFTTVKDRGREEVEDMVLTDFGKDYLMKIAMWRP
jgi:hypothetical protein